jgi:hypothetical protein
MSQIITISPQPITTSPEYEPIKILQKHTIKTGNNSKKFNNPHKKFTIFLNQYKHPNATCWEQTVLKNIYIKEKQNPRSNS